MRCYKLEIAGLLRDLPICAINEGLSIAAFIMTGDVELTIACAAELLQKSPEFDIILTAEAKSIPLCYEMARQSGKPYVVARKSKKLYMSEVIAAEVCSITTALPQTLFIDKVGADRLCGKRVLIVDDVISTGESLKALEKLVALAGGAVAAKMAVLAEGDAALREDIVFLEKLPLFAN